MRSSRRARSRGTMSDRGPGRGRRGAELDRHDRGRGVLQVRHAFPDPDPPATWAWRRARGRGSSICSADMVPHGTPHTGKALRLIDALDALGDLYDARPWPVGTWKEGDYLKAEKRVRHGHRRVALQVNTLSELFTLSDTLSKDMVASCYWSSSSAGCGRRSMQPPRRRERARSRRRVIIDRRPQSARTG